MKQRRIHSNFSTIIMNCKLVILLALYLVFAEAQNDAGNVQQKYLPVAPTEVESRSTTSGCGCIRLLNLDTIATGSNTRLSTIPNGYGGLNWVNAGLVNATWERQAYGWNGYATALTSGIFVGFNSNAQQMSMSVPIGQYFQLNSISLAAAWRNNLALTITATRSNAVIFRTVVNLQVASRTTLYTLKWSGIDKVTFDSSGGTVYPNLSGTGTHFVFDDIDITI